MRNNIKGINWLLVICISTCYYLLGYETQRHDTILLLSLVGFLFIAYSFICFDLSKSNLKFWIWSGIIFRLVFILSVPSLSDDIFRFLWDGRMIANGINPFEFLPEDVLNGYPGLNDELYQLLNSQGRPTIYPPISQFIFWISSLFGSNDIMTSIVVMRAILLIVEVGTILLILRLLKSYGISKSSALLYWLNPLVILEISGNLHYEGLMVFFILLALSLLLVRRSLLAAIAWALAVGTKLLPLMIIPIFIRRLGFRKFILFATVILIATIAVFAPLLSVSFYKGLSDAISLYFVKFEFNASLYYLVRELGFYKNGWNMIAIIGPRLAFTSVLLILGYTWYESKRPVRIAEAIIWIFLIYFLLAMIVHPWYIITIVAFSVFTKYRWPLVWSGLIFLSYAGYTQTGYLENYWLFGLEYGILILYIIYETRKRFYQTA